jgi:CheY-like chemotaxis protein
MNIRNAMEEQMTGSQQILVSVGRLKEISVTVKKGTDNVSDSCGELDKETQELINITNEVSEGFNQIASGAMFEIKKAVTHVDEMSAENNKNFTELKEETEQFKVSSGNEKKIILLVDDDGTVLVAVRGMLSDTYEVITAKSGQEALTLFYRGLVPNLILLDLKMPGMDGWETFERINSISNLHTTPVAIFSSSTDPENKTRTQKMGIKDFIPKSIAKDELLARIKKLI